MLQNISHNISQTIFVSATEFISEAWKNEKTIETLEKVKNSSTKEETEKAKKEFFDFLSPESQKQFKTVGIELPTDNVKLTLTLGSFIFDIIVPSIPKPSAPLRLAAYNKHIGDLAEKLTQPDFDLTLDELESLRKVLDDDGLWSQVKIEADLGSSLSIPLSQNGIQMFDQVINAAIKLFEPEKLEEEKEEPKKEKKKESPKKRGRKPKS